MEGPSLLRILVCLGGASDRAVAGRLLRDAHLEFQLCSGPEELLREVSTAGALLLEDGVLTDASVAQLNAVLGTQPSWSDLPVVLLTRRTPGLARRDSRAPLERNVTRMERPLASETLLSVLRMALQARRRQYEVRDLLQSLGHRVEAATADLRQSNVELRAAHDELEQRVRERTAELEQRAAQLSRLTSELTLVEQRERQRLATLLHDHLQQLLVGMRMGLDVLARRVGPDHRGAVEQARGLADEAITASRSLTAELAPPILREGGLATGLEWLARWMADRHGLAVEVSAGPEAQPEREDVKVLLFQSVRELLFNVVKHAGVTRATVEVTRRDDQHIQVTVADEGAGFRDGAGANAPADLTGGFGLFSIRERLHLLGGCLEIRTAPGGGTRITLVAPCRSDEAPSRVEQVPRAAPGHRPTSTSAAAPGVRRILLVDDHVVMREGLSQLLGGEPDLEVVGQAADGLEAVELARQLRPDVILMDSSMPRMDGVAAARVIHAEQPGVRIIGLSMYDEADRARAMFEAGAVGYLTKSGPTDPLLAAIRSAGGGAA